MKKVRILLLIIVVCFMGNSGYSQNGIIKDKKKKIVLIPGQDSHAAGEHEHMGGCQLLAKLLNENVSGVTAIVTEIGWPKDTTILDDASSILMFCDGGDEHIVLPHMSHMDRLMKMGVGLVNLHYAVEIPKGEAGVKFLSWIGGYFELNYSVNPHWTINLEGLPIHPITRGISSFQVNDEWYYHLRFVQNDTNLIPILKALPPASTLDRPDGPHSNNSNVRESVLLKKEPQTVAWAYTRAGGGRGFGFTGAHEHRNWMDDNFRKLVINALLWTAKIQVPEKGIVTSKPTVSEMQELQKKYVVPFSD